jgi:hypothetical protein
VNVTAVSAASESGEGLPGRSLSAERNHRKIVLAAAYRIFAMNGYDHHLAGHITARDPEFLDQFWVAPLGPWFGKITKPLAGWYSMSRKETASPPHWETSGPSFCRIMAS